MWTPFPGAVISRGDGYVWRWMLMRPTGAQVAFGEENTPRRAYEELCRWRDWNLFIARQSIRNHRERPLNV